MVAVVIGRELLITGVRGYVESLGKKFGADWFGKLKTILQCLWLLAVLVYLTLREHCPESGLVGRSRCCTTGCCTPCSRRRC